MPNNDPLGEINLEHWTQYDDIITDSLWLLGKRDNTGAHTAEYWGNFVPQIPQQAMRRFTKRGELVIDPFIGLGTTLIEAVRLGRHAIGVDIQPRCVEQAQARVQQETGENGAQALAIVGDSTRPETAAAVQEVMRAWGFPHAHLLILHPPYHDIIRFSEAPNDLSNAPSTEAFLEGFGQVVAKLRAAAGARAVPRAGHRRQVRPRRMGAARLPNDGGCAAKRLSAQEHLRQGYSRESRQAGTVPPLALPRSQAQLLCVQARVCDVFREGREVSKSACRR
jgi:hypothetical protein